jgi:hypothetical protein
METLIQKDPQMTERELARLGGGVFAYIKIISAKEARKRFPDTEGLPKKGRLFTLCAADGTPLVITDKENVARGRAIDEELEIASLH